MIVSSGNTNGYTSNGGDLVLRAGSASSDESTSATKSKGGDVFISAGKASGRSVSDKGGGVILLGGDSLVGSGGIVALSIVR